MKTTGEQWERKGMKPELQNKQGKKENDRKTT